jgi:hypothetical protein
VGIVPPTGKVQKSPPLLSDDVSVDDDDVSLDDDESDGPVLGAVSGGGLLSSAGAVLGPVSGGGALSGEP